MNINVLGLALHRAKEIGGPWGPPCYRYVSGTIIPVPYGFDSGEFECECPQQASHLLELAAQIIAEPVT